MREMRLPTAAAAAAAAGAAAANVVDMAVAPEGGVGGGCSEVLLSPHLLLVVLALLVLVLLVLVLVLVLVMALLVLVLGLVSVGWRPRDESTPDLRRWREQERLPTASMACALTVACSVGVKGRGRRREGGRGG